MSISELCLSDATELAELVRTKKASPVEVVDAFLDQIDRVDPAVNAICTPLHEQARERAKAAEAAVARNEDLGPLHGVPIVFKDFTDTQGIRTTSGSLVRRDHVPDRDALVVERALDAGAIILGKSQTPEFALAGFTRNKLFGATRNPWDLGRTPGGSSGGSAAAVAAAMTPVAEGSDAGGSIRAPASATGIYGLKPQFGRIPFDAFRNKYSTLMTFGPMTRTVRDAALLMDVWSGPDERDPWSLPAPGHGFVGALDGDLTGLRVGYSPDFGHVVHPDVAAVVETGVKVLESLGCEVRRIPLGGWAEGHRAWNTIWAADMAGELGHLLPENEELMLDGTVDMIRRGLATTVEELERAHAVRSSFYGSVQRLFEDHDVIVTPVLAISPPSVDAFYRGPEVIGDVQIDPVSGWFFTCQFNLTGHPAASIPTGFTPDGLPVGLQVVGRRFADDTVLRVSARFEEAAPWRHHLPPAAVGAHGG